MDVSYAPRTTASGAVIGTSVHTVPATGSASRTDQDLLGRTVKRGHQGFGGSWIEEATVYDLLGRVVTRTRPDVNKPSKQATQITLRQPRSTAPGDAARRRDRRVPALVLDLDAVGHVHRSRDRARSRWARDPERGGREEHAARHGLHLRRVQSARPRHRSRRQPDHGSLRPARAAHVGQRSGRGHDELLLRRIRRRRSARRWAGIRPSRTYDVLGRLTQTDHAGELTVTTWDTHGAGRLAHTLSPDGVEQDFTYTPLGQLDTLTYTVDGEDFEFKMGYDGLGRVVNLAYPKVPGQSAALQRRAGLHALGLPRRGVRSFFVHL